MKKLLLITLLIVGCDTLEPKLECEEDEINIITGCGIFRHPEKNEIQVLEESEIEIEESEIEIEESEIEIEESEGEVENCVDLWGQCYNIEETKSLILNGIVSESILSSIGNLTNLTSLEISNNINLTGNIPSSIGNLNNLTSLILSNNNLTGNIPSSIGNLTNLKYLYLASNQLDGSIPSEIGKLTSLEILVLNSNKLTGNIPQELCNLIESNNLYIHNILVGNNDLINTCD